MQTKSSWSTFDHSRIGVQPAGAEIAERTNTEVVVVTAGAVLVAMRPNTLNVVRDKKSNDTKKFIREALHAWRKKARGTTVVAAERLRDLFEELNFCPTDKQINEMLQTAKLFARRGSSIDPGSRRVNGLTFGEFCVLAADLKRFRTQNLTRCHDNSATAGKGFLPAVGSPQKTNASTNVVPVLSNFNDEKAVSSDGGAAGSTPSPSTSDVNAPEVFLGGSCNPTTWRADVAIPALDKLGISFYNPQVSDWTPDLIELEHRAKEKARVLFFVMDSETRASAGAIEAAHIAGQNSRHLVLVLHPYKPDQCILNEPISSQEYLDLKRNQELLRELVIRRGLQVLDSIPSGLQRTRAILAGTSERRAPYNIASCLISVRRAFDLVADQSVNGRITIGQCQVALPLLGYAQNLLSADTLVGIVESHRESSEATGSSDATSSSAAGSSVKMKNGNISITFDEFCVVTSYLAILQQEIHESGCVSPIKGTNLPPPPIFLTNTPEWTHQQHHHHPHDPLAYVKQIYRTSSCKSVPEDHSHNGGAEMYRNRDSGTSSPQPHESTRTPPVVAVHGKNLPHHVGGKKTKISLHVDSFAIDHEDESDSNDSVFSSGSSSDSNLGEIGQQQLRHGGMEVRDIYLGGSCMLRTKWRKDFAIPFLNHKGVTYHLPILHESICSLIPECNETESIENVEANHIEPAMPDRSSTLPKVSSKKKNSHLLKLKTVTMSNGVPTTTSPRLADADDRHTHDIEYGAEANGGTSTAPRKMMFNPIVLDASRVLLFVITNETRSLAPMTLAAHYIGLGYNVVLCVQMLPEFCIIGHDKLTVAAIKDYNRGRAYLIDLAKRQGVPVFSDLKQTMECAVEKAKTCNSRNSI